MSTIKFKPTKEELQFLKSYSTIIDRQYYYMPYCFKDAGDGTFEACQLEALPDEVRLIAYPKRKTPSNFTTSKYYTSAEGGEWKPFPSDFIFKERFVPPIDKKVLTLKHLGVPFEVASIMFSDGTIYDVAKAGFRDETDFPRAEVLEYMQNVLEKL